MLCVCVNFIQELLCIHSFTSTPNDRFLEKLFMAVTLTLRVFVKRLAKRGDRRKKYFFIFRFVRCLSRGLNYITVKNYVCYGQIPTTICLTFFYYFQHFVIYCDISSELGLVFSVVKMNKIRCSLFFCLTF